MEGVHNAQAMSDAVNAEYVKNMNEYPNPLDTSLYTGTVSKFFEISATLENGGKKVKVKAKRNSDRDSYTIKFISQGGEVTDRSCSGNTEMAKKYCKALGIAYTAGSI